MCESDSTSRHSAGIVIYVHRTVQYKIVDEIVYEFNNIIVVDVLKSPCRGRWIFVYHSPNTSHSVFLSKLDELCKQVLITKGPIRVVDDFTINYHSSVVSETYKNRLKSLGLKYDLKQIVNAYTLCCRDSKSMIDLCFVNNDDIKVKTKWLIIVIFSYSNSKVRKWSQLNVLQTEVNSMLRII